MVKSLLPQIDGMVLRGHNERFINFCGEVDIGWRMLVMERNRMRGVVVEQEPRIIALREQKVIASLVGEMAAIGLTGGENMRNCPLIRSSVVVSCYQQTRQASIRKEMLKFGGFLFFRRAA